jgi:tripartite-type tricarboxylate transporter receptor subunit TctC
MRRKGRNAMTTLHTRLFGIVAAATAATVFQIQHLQAENVYPLRLVVPCAVGTPADLLARHVAKAMLQDWDQSVLVENLPGGIEGVRRGADGRPLADGRTIILNLGNCGDESDGFWPALSRR